LVGSFLFRGGLITFLDVKILVATSYNFTASGPGAFMNTRQITCSSVSLVFGTYLHLLFGWSERANLQSAVHEFVQAGVSAEIDNFDSDWADWADHRLWYRPQ
jgi:hypothetical protein